MGGTEDLAFDLAVVSFVYRGGGVGWGWFVLGRQERKNE